MSANKQVIQTSKAPKAIGPYSQAIRAGGFLFCSGQVPLDPVTGQIVGTETKEQTIQVMKNIEAVLTEAGCSFDSVIKATIFLKSMDEFPVVNEIYGSYFKGTFPARSTVEVSRLPKDVRVEIEVIAQSLN